MSMLPVPSSPPTPINPLTGYPDPYASPGLSGDPAILAMASSLLGSSGWSPTPVGFGQAMGSALQAGHQARRTHLSDVWLAQQRQHAASQMARERAQNEAADAYVAGLKDPNLRALGKADPQAAMRASLAGSGPKFAYKERDRRTDDGRIVQEISEDGGRTWQPLGDPYRKAPEMETIYDPLTGQPYRARYNPATDSYDRVGGIKRGENKGQVQLTKAQERTNKEITEARAAISQMGLGRDEILRRSQSTLNTGRENPDYDPYLANLVNTAAQPLYGEDPAFRGTYHRLIGSGTPPPQPAPPQPAPPVPSPVPAASPRGFPPLPSRKPLRQPPGGQGGPVAQNQAQAQIQQMAKGTGPAAQAAQRTLAKQARRPAQAAPPRFPQKLQTRLTQGGEITPQELDGMFTDDELARLQQEDPEGFALLIAYAEEIDRQQARRSGP